MTFMEWLQLAYAVCTSADAPPNWREIAIVANLTIAVAYFWIPLAMIIVFFRWKREIPFPWLWGGFVVFIVACGTSHIVHAFHALSEQTPYNTSMLNILIFTAAASLATAVGFTFIMPKIMALTSPSAALDRLEAAVAEATGDLEAALAHEKLLMREIHHRVKNNLQVTASLVNLHLRRSKLPDTSEFDALRSRITAMADVHMQLESVGARPLSVSGFCKSLGDKLQISHGRGQVALRISGPDFEVSLDHAASLALILNEVLSNAYTHGFAPRSPGTIAIELGRNAHEQTISISDDGRGRSGANPPGIGTLLITSCAVQLGAAIEWLDRPEGGTSFLLTIPRASDPPVGAAKSPS